MLPDTYHSELHTILTTKYWQWLPKTVKTLKSRLRALDRDLDEADLRNPTTVLQYRAQLADGTNNILSSLWNVLQETEVAKDLPDFVRKPMVMFTHPLFADVMLLGAAFGNERLPDLTWGDVNEDFRFDERERQSAFRCLTWALGSDEADPVPSTPLVPKDAQLTPMQLWQIEYIINSPTQGGQAKKTYVKAQINRLIEAFVVQSVRLNVPASTLRFCCDRSCEVGNKVEEVDFPILKTRIEGAWGPSTLIAIAQTLPQDKPDNSPRMW